MKAMTHDEREEGVIFKKESERLRPEVTRADTEATVRVQHGPMQQASPDLSVRTAGRKSLRSEEAL